MMMGTLEDARRSRREARSRFPPGIMDVEDQKIEAQPFELGRAHRRRLSAVVTR